MKVLDDIIYPALEDIKGSLGSDVNLKKSSDTPLFGSDSMLDSLGLVTFIVAVEERITDIADRSITLADEKAFSQARSPFRTIGTLAEYISMRLNEDE